MNMMKYEQIPHSNNFVSTVQVCTQWTWQHPIYQILLQLSSVSSVDTLFMMHINISFLAHDYKINKDKTFHLGKQIQYVSMLSYKHTNVENTKRQATRQRLLKVKDVLQKNRRITSTMTRQTFFFSFTLKQCCFWKQ